jgi:hypothetical protein
LTLPLSQFVSEFASALKAVDATKPQGSSRTRTYRPGVGPLREDDAVSRALAVLRGDPGAVYLNAGPRSYPRTGQECDLVIPGEWAMELKLLRPFGDNCVEFEHWSENVLHPYAGTTSSVGDCLKLVGSGFAERKAVVVFGYEHTPPQISLEPAVRAFELIVPGVAGIPLSVRYEALAEGLVHPCHQQVRVFAWEVINPEASSV